MRRPRVRFDAIGEAWGLFLEKAGTWILAGLMVLVGNWALLAVVASVLGEKLPPAGGGFRSDVPTTGQVVDAVLAAVLNGLFLGGLFRMACNQVRGRPVRVCDLLKLRWVFRELVIGSAIYALIVAVAGLFCFIPALVASGVLMLTIPLVVDGGLTGVDAVRQSWYALKGQWFSAAAFHLFVNILAVLGGFCFCFGLVFTIPLYVLSIAVLYRDYFPTTREAAWKKPVGLDPDFG